MKFDMEENKLQKSLEKKFSKMASSHETDESLKDSVFESLNLIEQTAKVIELFTDSFFISEVNYMDELSKEKIKKESE